MTTSGALKGMRLILGGSRRDEQSGEASLKLPATVLSVKPKKKCCTSKPRCRRCPIRLLSEGALPPGYTVRKRKLVKVAAPLDVRAADDAKGKQKSGKKKKNKSKKKSKRPTVTLAA
jgi:hypothetical protein